MEKVLGILYTLHAQAVMASIEHVRRRACCVWGSVLANFGMKTSTILLIRSTLLLATADRVLDFPIGLCYSSGRYGVESAPVRSGSLSFDLKKRNKDILLTQPHVHVAYRIPINLIIRS